MVNQVILDIQVIQAFQVFLEVQDHLGNQAQAVNLDIRDLVANQVIAVILEAG